MTTPQICQIVPCVMTMTMLVKSICCQVSHPASVHNQKYTQWVTIRYHIFITVIWQRGLEAIAYMPRYELAQYLSWGASNNKQRRVQNSGGNSWY